MVKKVMGAMSPQREWIRENMKPKTSPKTLEIQAAKQVQSKAFLFWDTENKGTYLKRERMYSRVPKKRLDK